MGPVHLLFVVLQRLPFNALVKHIDLGLGELPGANSLLKEQIQLGKCPPGRFWYSEVGVYDAKEANASLWSPSQ